MRSWELHGIRNEPVFEYVRSVQQNGQTAQSQKILLARLPHTHRQQQIRPKRLIPRLYCENMVP